MNDGAKASSVLPYEIRATAQAGRSVFATQTLHNGNEILTTDGTASPLSYVIMRPYWREVCVYCFNYDRGREWRLRLTDAGVAFCCDDCQNEWLAKHLDTRLEAWKVVEKTIKNQLKRSNGKKDESVGGLGSKLQLETTSTLSSEEVVAFWNEAEKQVETIFDIRQGSRSTKTLRRAEALQIDPDITKYILTGVLAVHEAYAARKDSEQGLVGHRLPQSNHESSLPDLYTLAADNELFAKSPQTLHAYRDAYIYLAATLPMDLLSCISAALVQALADRASHNAFSIRPFASTSSATTDDEFLGWGVWPAASYFNHSCAPNVRKQRFGRHWNFVVDAESVPAGGELCITYLGGDEKDLDVRARRERLQGEWGFLCMCTRCKAESIPDV